MSEPLDGLAPEELRRLGSIVANICTPGEAGPPGSQRPQS